MSIKELKELKEYDRLYALGLSPISDTEYDNLKDEVFKIDPENPYFKSVGAPISSRDKVKLPFHLGSLKKTKIIQKDEKISSVMRWVLKQNDDIIISPKLDGVSILVNYKNGIVSKAYLRGDGEFGQEITSKARKFIKPIKEQKSIWARGEVQLNFLPKEYKQKRAATAGILNDDDHKYLPKLEVLFYENINSKKDNEFDRMIELQNVGIPVNDFTKLPIHSITEDGLVKQLKDIKERFLDKGLDTDGIVLTKNISTRENVAYPTLKVAFKVNQDAINTVVTMIDWNTSRNGRVIPLIHIKPIVINGSTVSKVTGHNAKYIQDNQICIGLDVNVCLSGDVIPFLILN